MKSTIIKLSVVVLILLLSGCGGTPATDEPNVDNGGSDTPTNEPPVEVVVDNTPPVITISGTNPFTITQGETYADAGATATDDIDGEIEVVPSGEVIMSVAGTYTITYTAVDEAGHEVNATRTVIVKPADVIWNVSNMTEFRDALESAALNGTGDKIILEAGTYNVMSDNLGTLNFDDNEEFNLTIQAKEGLTYSDVILDGNNTQQVFNFDNKLDSTLTIKNISLINGKSSIGGGIYSGNNIVIEDCNISNNTSTTYSLAGGGGFYAINKITLRNSIISYNTSNHHGGGLYTEGTTTVINSTISYNTSNKNGGGLYAGGTTIVIDSTISHNTSASSYGGGLYAHVTTITGSNISYNTSGYGGGLCIVDELYISNSSFMNNRASVRGTLLTTSSVIMVNSLIANSNDAVDTSGFYYAPQKSYFSNNVFMNNTGTALSSEGVFVNNIFVDNENDISLTGETSVYNNYIDYAKIIDNDKSIYKKSNLQPASVGDIYLSDDNVTLLSNSPVIDKGLNIGSTTYKDMISDETVYARLNEFLTTDKVGNVRVFGDLVDMGAVEYGSSK